MSLDSLYDHLPFLFELELRGQAYAVSVNKALGNNEELNVHFDPVEAGGVIFLEAPDIEAQGTADVEVYENVGVGDTTDDVFVHNKRYNAREEPECTVLRIDNGQVTTTGADQTLDAFIQAGSRLGFGGGEDMRGIWRIVPVTDTITVKIINDSGGNNEYSFTTTLYEGPIVEIPPLPEDQQQ